MGGATDEEFHRGSDRVEEYLDLAYYGRFHRQLKAPPHRYPMPAPLTVGDLGSVLGQAGSYEGVQVVEEPPECRA